MKMNKPNIVHVKFLLLVVMSLSLAGCSAMRGAVRRGDTAKVKELIKKGANVNNTYNFGKPTTALVQAAGGGHMEIVRALLKAGANVHHRDKYGGTALHAAANYGHVAIAKLLLEAGADVNAKNSIQETPLWNAAAYLGQPGTVKFLLEAGADLDVPNNRGVTILKYVQVYSGISTPEIIQMLKKAKADGSEVRAAGRERKARQKSLKAKIKAAKKAVRANLPFIRALMKAGDKSRKAGDQDEALENYLAALKKTPRRTKTDFKIRKKIIRYVRSTELEPELPESANRHSIRAQAFLKRVESPEEYERVIDEFEKVLLLAPWWADAYFNLALVQEKSDDYSSATSNMKLYLLAAPDAPDAGDVRKKLYELEVAQELEGTD